MLVDVVAFRFFFHQQTIFCSVPFLRPFLPQRLNVCCVCVFFAKCESDSARKMDVYFIKVLYFNVKKLITFLVCQRKFPPVYFVCVYEFALFAFNPVHKIGFFADFVAKPNVANERAPSCLEVCCFWWVSTAFFSSHSAYLTIEKAPGLMTNILPTFNQMKCERKKFQECLTTIYKLEESISPTVETARDGDCWGFFWMLLEFLKMMLLYISWNLQRLRVWEMKNKYNLSQFFVGAGTKRVPGLKFTAFRFY